MNWKDILLQWIIEADALGDYDRANRMRITYNALYHTDKTTN